MRALAVAVVMAGLVLVCPARAQVKQTELPPPAGVSSAASSTKAPEATQKGKQTPGKKGKLTPEQKAAETAAEEARWGGNNKEKTDPSPPTPLAPAPEVQPSPVQSQPVAQPAAPAAAATTATVTKATSGKRVAAFWIITPGK